ncbi:MAG: carboxypeptidase-like regulatory domain-containing protein [Ferruginibacter sp.]|nr:carboxypeptidase-like regulatory domain-containing protein [Ferruginibacter sp.]
MQKLQLSIPEPCHENWNGMTPTEQGRFCNACAKEVVDFSTMTDIQVLNYFTNITNEKVCGRALPEQLNRTISRPEPPKKKLFWYWNYIVMFFMFFSKTNTVKAQRGIKAVCNSRATSDAELDKIKNDDINKVQANINNALAGKVGEVAISRIFTGKVTDEIGNPVAFASVKIKGTNNGFFADANGAYSIKINPDAILIISGIGFKEAEFTTGNQSVLHTVLQKAISGGIEMVTVGGLLWSNPDDYYGPLDKSKRVAVIRVKDEASGKPIPNANLIIESDYKKSVDTVLTDKKGMYKIKRIKDGDEYAIKISVKGYEPNEFTIEEYDFENRKKVWEVLLRRKVDEVRPTTKIGGETRVRMGAVSSIAPVEILYVIDGIIAPKGFDINPDDVEDIAILKGPEASALFGSIGANGAIVITTRKAKEIKMQEVVVTTEVGTRRTIKGAMAGSVVIINQSTYLSEKIAAIKTILSDSIKVYPNPVQRNSDFSVQLKLKQPGKNCSIIISDATGKILLQRKFNASAKEHTEKLTADNRWAAGIYYIRIFDAKNKLISKSSFVFQ